MKEKNIEGEKKAQKLIYGFLYPSFAYFSVCIYLLAVSIKLFDYKVNALTPGAIFGILFFSILLASCNFIFFTKLPGALKILLHYLAMLVLYFIVIAVALGGFSSGLLIGAVVITPVYFLFALIAWIIRKAVPEKVIRRFLFPLGFYYFLAVMINEALLYTLQVTASAPGFLTLSKLWVFAAVMCIGEQIFRTKLNDYLKVFLHFLVTMASVVGVHIFFVRNYSKGSDAIVPCVVIAVIYFLIAAVGMFIKVKIDGENNKNKEYKSNF